MWGQKFRRNILPPYTLKMEAVCAFETPVAMYHMYNNRSPVGWGEEGCDVMTERPEI
jgi:hypothetical protein